MGGRVGAVVIRLHDKVVTLLARLFRSLCSDALVELILLFAELSGDRSNQRLRNPRGFGRQIILDTALTGIDGRFRTSDYLPDRPLKIRYDQKMAEYG